MNPNTATPAALQAILEAHQNIDTLVSDQRSIDPVTRGIVIDLLHRIEDALSSRKMRIDLSSALATTDINEAWGHHAALELLNPLLHRLTRLGFELTRDAVQ